MRRIIITVDLPDETTINASSREVQDALKKAVHGVVGGWPNVTVTNETLSGPPCKLYVKVVKGTGWFASTTPGFTEPAQYLRADGALYTSRPHYLETRGQMIAFCIEKGYEVGEATLPSSGVRNG